MSSQAVCTCPSGDGSLHWPCPSHPPGAGQVCIHCQAEPELRRDTASGRVMWICPECKARGVACKSPAYARGTWSIINDDELPLHHCKNGVRPRFFMRDGKWGCRCTACGFESGLVMTVEGAVASWMSESRSAQERKSVYA